MDKLPKQRSKQPIQISLPTTRKGLLGSLDLGREYMAGVEARARRMQMATRIERSKNKLPAVQPSQDDR